MHRSDRNDKTIEMVMELADGVHGTICHGDRLMFASESGDMMRKIVPLPGTIRAEWVRCGKAACRCATGRRHGPYVYRRWREDGRQRRQYVRAGDRPKIEAVIAAWHRQHPPVWATRQELAELRRLSRELRALGFGSCPR